MKYVDWEENPLIDPKTGFIIWKNGEFSVWSFTIRWDFSYKRYVYRLWITNGPIIATGQGFTDFDEAFESMITNLETWLKIRLKEVRE